MRLPWLQMKFFKFWKVFPKSPTVTVFFKEFLAQPQDCSILKSVPFLIWWLILKKRATDEYERTRRKKVHWSECLAATHGNLLTLWKSISDSPESRRKNFNYVYWVRSQSCNEITDECSKTAFLVSVLWTYSLWKLLTKTYPTENIVFLLWNRFALDRGFREEF